MFDLEGKVALVTGAASGIGLAYVKELLRNKLKGVALVDINDTNGECVIKEIIKEFGENCAIFVKTDVSDKTQLERTSMRKMYCHKSQTDTVQGLVVVVLAESAASRIGSGYIKKVLGNKLKVCMYTLWDKMEQGNTAVMTIDGKKWKKTSSTDLTGYEKWQTDNWTQTGEVTPKMNNKVHIIIVFLDATHLHGI